MNRSKVYNVKSVSLATLRSNPPKLSISAKGSVPSGGWSDAILIPYTYIQAPPDGIYDFDFVAAPPNGPATQAFADIEANLTLETTSQNNVVSLLNGSSVTGTTICIKGQLTDEGVECQALRTHSNELYTLVGDLKGFSVGDNVCVSGTVAEISFCMQGITISFNTVHARIFFRHIKTYTHMQEKLFARLFFNLLVNTAP